MEKFQTKEAFLSSIKMRIVNEADCMDLFNWRNDPVTRKNSVSNTDAVPLEDHKKWFAVKLKDPHSRIYIGVAEKNKVGMMRFDVEDDHIVVTTHVNPLYRGIGVGTKIMALTTRDAYEKFKKPIIAKIRNDNVASIKMCAKNGYIIKEKTKDTTYMQFSGDGF